MVGRDHLDAFLAAQRRRGLTDKHLEQCRLDLDGFYVFWAASSSSLPPDRLDAPCVDAYRRLLQTQRTARGEPLSLRTQQHRLSSLRAFFRFLARQNVLACNPAELVPLPRAPAVLRRVLSEDELVQLCEATTGEDPRTLRNRAYLELLVATAMRPKEAAALRLSDLDLPRGWVRIRRGKGDRLRTLPLTRAAVRALRRYCKRGRRALIPRGTKSDRLFVSEDGQLGRAARVDIVVRAAAHAGLDGHVTPYTLRHSVATALVRAGMELRHLQVLLGHARAHTTEVYLHLGPQDLKAAHRRAHPRERNRREPKGRRR